VIFNFTSNSASQATYSKFLLQEESMENYKETVGLPPVLVTAVGSLPHLEATSAVDLIFTSTRTAPHAPQLSRSDPREQMWIQCTEGLPRFKVDLENLKYHFDTSGDPMAEVEAFYTEYLNVEEGASALNFAIGPEYGKGIHAFLARLADRPEKLKYVKAQVTGPLSFALTVQDQSGRPIFYDSTFRDVAVKGMGLKAVWLVEQLKPLAEKVILFFDEPSLSAYGSSAYIGVSKADVIESLNEVLMMVVEKGGIPGVHCCGNTDWGMLMETATRIVNFDAVDYMDTMAIYSRELSEFLARGGVLAWGAVPNTEKIDGESSASVVRRLRDGLSLLEKAGVDSALLRQKMFVTPACGCAGLSVEMAEKVYRVLADLDLEPIENILGIK
jgi:hypothetical protein